MKHEVIYRKKLELTDPDQRFIGAYKDVGRPWEFLYPLEPAYLQSKDKVEAEINRYAAAEKSNSGRRFKLVEVKSPDPSPLTAQSPDPVQFQLQEINRKLDQLLAKKQRPGMKQAPLPAITLRPGNHFMSNDELKLEGVSKQKLGRVLKARGIKSTVRNIKGKTVRGYLIQKQQIEPGMHATDMEMIQTLEPGVTHEELTGRGFTQDINGNYLCNFLK